MADSRSETTNRHGPLSTRDPARAGFKAAILARLRDRKNASAAAAEPGMGNWRAAAARYEMACDLIAEIEGMQE